MELPHTSIDPSVAADMCTFPHSAKPMIADSVIDRMELASGIVKCVPVSWHTSQNRTALRWEKRITVRSYVSIVIFVCRLFATLKMSF